jgi:cysteine dioxygenase
MNSLQELIIKIQQFMNSSPQTIEDFQPIMAQYIGDDYKDSLTFSPQKYTRKIIEKNVDFELVLIGWEKEQISLPHSHSERGCVMKVLAGEITETRYYKDGSEKDFLCKENSVSYIHNADAFHKIGNQSKFKPAVSLNLYSPGEYNARFSTCAKDLWEDF